MKPGSRAWPGVSAGSISSNELSCSRASYQIYEYTYKYVYIDIHIYILYIYIYIYVIYIYIYVNKYLQTVYIGVCSISIYSYDI